ncbi:MAG: 50S ribosomal protein L4 [Gammaproteobacteria bacterium]|nr:50S ribosomal protein L4 [Gammaproteobacteria bacterium]MCD8542542.1 50S ribosomal protein L4 [Gammaproteobacteria bacterium]
MEFSLISSAQELSEKIVVSDRVFGQIFNDDLVHQVVVAYQAGGRQGTKAQKNRAAVRGGGIKPWRQKGTGRARAGTIRSPIWVGGGKAFAATPRNFMQKVNKKMYNAAMRSILSRLANDGVLLFVDDVVIDSPKTKEMVQKLNAYNVSDVLIICSEISENLYLAARNLGHVDVIDVPLIDPLSLLSYKNVLVTKDALPLIEERFS